MKSASYYIGLLKQYREKMLQSLASKELESLDLWLVANKIVRATLIFLWT